MDSFEFLTEIPAFTKDKALPIYFTKKYLNQFDSELSSFGILNKETHQMVCVIHFQIKNDTAMSLDTAPFGGIYFFQPIGENFINAFLDFVIDRLKEVGISQINIHTAPAFYSTYNPNPESIFKGKHFSKYSTDVNHHICINEDPLINRITPMQQRRLKKNINANIIFKKESESNLEQIFTFISACRKDRKHALSMSFDQINSAFAILPGEYIIFSCYHGNTLVAATICVIVNDKVIYNFLPASAVAYDSYSPMVYLISNIYQFCQLHSYEILDLGTSMLNNQPNESLIAFKRRMGGVQTERFCFKIDL